MDIDHLSYKKTTQTRDLKPKGRSVATNVIQNPPAHQKASKLINIVAPEYTKPDASIDSKILFIISGGEKREKNYFHIFFTNQQRINTVIAFLSKSNQGLKPYELYDNAINFIKTKKFTTEDGKSYSIGKDDIIYLIQDIDDFQKQILSLPLLPKSAKWILSNPCFEMWLYYHYFNSPLPHLQQLESENTDQRSQTLKTKLDILIPGGVQTTKIIKNIELATKNSRQNYSEDGLIPNLFSTQMHNLATELIKMSGNELNVLFQQKEAEANKMRQNYQAFSNTGVTIHSGYKIDKFIDDLSNFANANPITLPSTAQPLTGCPRSDKRIFSIGYEVPQNDFIDSVPSHSNNLFELYYNNIVSSIKQYYLTLFAKMAPNSAFNITYFDFESLITKIANIPGISVLTTVDLSNIRSVKHLDSYYYIDSVRPVIIIIPKLYLPHIEHITYNGSKDDYKQIDSVNLLYSNIYNMPVLSSDHFGLTILKELNIHIPQTSNIRYILFNILDIPSQQSEASEFSIRNISELFYEKGDIIKFSNKLFKIKSIQASGDVTLQHLDNKIIPFDRIMPVKADGKEDANIFYNPVIAAGVVSDGQPLPNVHRDDGYYKNTLKKSFIEGESDSVYQIIQDCKFQYVHEIQHWMRVNMGKDELFLK